MIPVRVEGHNYGGMPDSLTEGLETYLNFNAVSTWGKKKLNAEGGSADRNYQWSSILPANDDYPSSWSVKYDVYPYSDPVLISIMDEGIDMTHPELTPFKWNPIGAGCGIPYSTTYSGFLFPDSSTIANGLTEPIDDTGHGTGVASTATSVADSLADVMVFNQRVSGVDDKATLFKAICAIYMAVEEDVQVVNMSLGYWGKRSLILESAIDRAETEDVIIVASAGNDSTDLSPFVGQEYGFYPANYTRDSFPNLITTSGYDNLKAPSDFSNFCDECTDVVGPSKNIRGAKYNTSTYDWFTGTSFTAPCVSGILASIYSGLGAATPYEIVLDTFFINYTRDSALYVGKVKNQKNAGHESTVFV